MEQIQSGTKCSVHTYNGSWSATVGEVNLTYGYFRLVQCDNARLITAAFDCRTQIRPQGIAHYNCSVEPTVQGSLLHHYNCWVTFP